MVALKVHAGAGLEVYGLSDGDLIVIDISDALSENDPRDDPRDGEPVFAAVNNKVMVGRYRHRPRDQVAIVPFDTEVRPVVAPRSEVPVVFSLRAIAQPGEVRLRSVGWI
jgi:SOS-response transcriptional repressor LexA